MNKRIQKKIWNQEHAAPQFLPSVADEKPSSAVTRFVDRLLQNNQIQGKRIIDVGCGKGRNAIYLAQQGLKVYAFDYISYAVDCAKERALQKNVSDLIQFSVASMDKKWKFPDNFFDFALDCYSSIDIESKEGRLIYKKELLRTLRPGGSALICVVSIEDEIEAALIRDNPGEEKNSSLWPENGKFQKNYDEQELQKFYSEFNIVELKKLKKKAIKLNKKFIGTTYWLLLEKPTTKPSSLE